MKKGLWLKVGPVVTFVLLFVLAAFERPHEFSRGSAYQLLLYFCLFLCISSLVGLVSTIVYAWTEYWVPTSMITALLGCTLGSFLLLLGLIIGQQTNGFMQYASAVIAWGGLVITIPTLWLFTVAPIPEKR